MDNTFIQIDGDLALSLASSVVSSLDGNFDYLFNILEENRLQKCAKASRRTLLHDYIGCVLMWNLTYIMLKHFDEEAIDEMKMWLDSTGITYNDLGEQPSDEDYKALEKYADLLQTRLAERALDKIEDAVSAILFVDKDFLYRFNSKITEVICTLKAEDYPEIFQADGYLKRENTPNWVKRGVFHRDRGRCQGCGTDLSRIFLNDNSENYDHIIPLKNGGTNDPTNIQLMCERCNKSKNARSSEYRNVIWTYWETE